MSATPTPADMPHAGLTRAEAMRRHRFSDGLITAVVEQHDRAEQPRPLAPPDALERLATEQGIGPVTDPDELAAPPDARLTDIEYETWRAAMRDPGTFPTELTRFQEIRHRALGHAIRFYQQDPDADLDDEDVLETARRFAKWIRRGDAECE